MLEWLLAGIDVERAHSLNSVLAWHARIMFFGWAVLVPVIVLLTRFFKILPNQDWPQEVDNQFWWRSHWMGHTLVVGLSVIGILIAYRTSVTPGRNLHSLLGYWVFALASIQVVIGLVRGSKGGPTAPLSNGNKLGDHYRMSIRRRWFEHLHKSNGYALIALSTATIIIGFWDVNAPRWMWMSYLIWWVLLIFCFIRWQNKGRAHDTYQAIWGPSLEHPGNRLPSQGWGMQRSPDDTTHEP